LPQQENNIAAFFWRLANRDSTNMGTAKVLTLDGGIFPGKGALSRDHLHAHLQVVDWRIGSAEMQLIYFARRRMRP
jgi:hypothetical protein